MTRKTSIFGDVRRNGLGLDSGAFRTSDLRDTYLLGTVGKG